MISSRFRRHPGVALGLMIAVPWACVATFQARVGEAQNRTPQTDARAGHPTSVKDFGAQGDGKTDDTAAIQRAVHESPDGVLEFPRGDYRITRTIEIRLSERALTSLSGRGGVGRVMMAGAGPAFRFEGTHTGSADPGSFRPAVWRQERMPQVEGLEIVGAHPDADGIEFVQVMQPTLARVLIREVRHGLRLTKRDRNLLLDGCHIYHCRGVGVFFDHVNLHQANVVGCHISYCKGGGIKVVGSEVRNLQVCGNDIEYNYDPDAKESADVWLDATEGSVREGALVGNTIQAKVSPGGANIRFVGPADVNKVSMFTITGNHISNQEVNVHLKNCRGIVLTGNSLALSRHRNLLVEGSRHIVIGANSIDHNPDYKQPTIDGITLRGCDGCTLSGVLLEGAAAGSAKAGGAIELFDCRETSVVGCQVFEPSFRGIYATGCRNTRIADCTVTDRVGKGNLLAPIHVAGQSTGTQIRGNLVDTGSVGGVLLEDRTGTSEGNQVVAR
jgi:Pectate lyase superfamily protein/Right handed beta helix region